MSCALTLSGIPLDCRDSVGGISAIWIGNSATKSTLTEAGGKITAISTPTNFKLYELRRETASFTETLNNSDENGTLFYSQELSFYLSKLQSSKRNEIVLLAKDDVLVIIKDTNGTKWLLGRENGMQLAGTSVTGTAFGDRSGYELTFSGNEREPAIEVTQALTGE